MKDTVKDYLKANILSDLFSRIVLGGRNGSKTRSLSVMVFLGSSFFITKIFRITKNILLPENRMKSAHKAMESIIPIMRYYGDVAEKITKDFRFENSRYLKLVAYNENWRHGIKSVYILTGNETGNLQIFVSTQEEQMIEMMYYDLVRYAGLPENTLMDISNIEIIYTYLRKNYL